VLYSKKGESRRAEESFLRAISLHAGYAEAYVNLGNLYLSEGKKGEAERIVAHARRCAPEVGGENKGCNL
jgi:Flp pilus assembly protein TadD